MPIAWVDDTGFHRLRLPEIKAKLEAEYRGINGLDIDVVLESTDAQEIGIYAELYDECLSTLEDVYNGRSPAGAIGAGLARLVRINGVKKKDVAYSTGTATLGTLGSVAVPVGAGAMIANVDDPTAVFVTQSDCIIPPFGTIDVGVKATVTGAVPGPAGALTVILTVINGWDTATNADEVSLGDAGETDAKLRTRRASSVALPSQGIVDGLRAAILQLPDVAQCVVRENPEDTTQPLADGGTLAPHAIQVIVKGGAPQAIADTIWLKKSAGVTMVGASTVTITDTQGVDHDINYDVPTGVPIYVRVNTTNALSSDVQQKVKDAIVARGQGNLVLNGVPLLGSQIGEDVAVSDIYEAISALAAGAVPGLKVNEIDIGTSPSPTTTTPVSIAFDAIATWDPANVSFNP